MNWWFILQIGQWLTQLNTPPKPYQLSDDVFFAQPTSHQIMVLERPDTLLLDVALFQATNEARRAAGLTIFQYDRGLYQAARNHAESMIRYDYISHEDLYQLTELTLLKRVEQQTKRFGWIAENIGQYQTIDTPDWYGVRFNTRAHQFEYINSESKQLYHPFSYAQYARYAVQQWLASPHHRANLLNPSFTYVGCAGRLCENPFRKQKAPYGRLVQNFGSPRLSTQVNR